MAIQNQGQVLPPSEDGEVVTTGGTLSAIEEADRTSMVAIAKKFPRSRTAFMTELSEIAQMSQPVAMEMMYSVPRAGKQLIGPSVRFAEALISCWGNSRAGVEIVDVDKEAITAEGRFYDCEKNVGISVRVRRRITDKQGNRFNADMIAVTGAAASSIALRGAILRGVPKALWADKFEMAKKTAAGDVKSMGEIKDRLFAYFLAIKVTEVQLFNALNVPGKEDVGAEEILAMNAWQKQLKAQECSVEDLFGSPEDDEIEKTMTALGWNETKKRMSRDSFKGKRADHLTYVRAEYAKMNPASSKPSPKATTDVPKEADTASAAAKPSDATTQASEPAESKPEPTKIEGGNSTTQTTTAEASTSQESKPATQDDFDAKPKAPATKKQTNFANF